MSNMVKVETVKLVSPRLDYAVALAMGIKSVKTNYLNGVDISQSDATMFNISGDPYCGAFGNGSVLFQPTINWDQCYPLILQYGVNVHSGDLMTEASIQWTGDSGIPFCRDGLAYFYGGTPQIAICRAVVFSKFGEWVEVPRKLAR
jgi:hypothetical protein